MGAAEKLENMITEKEKRDKGEWYDANNDPALQKEISDCQSRLYEYNMLRPEQVREKTVALRGILGKMGERCTVQPSFRCDYGYNIFLGDDVFINYDTVILDGAPVTVGNHVFIGPQCGFYTAIHPFSVSERNLGLERALPITIHDNVWIGGKVCILPGVTVGEGAVIGAGSVVTRDVPPYSVVAGNPARVIKTLENQR